MPGHRRQAVVLVLVMGVVALLAQVAGVGAKRSDAPRTAAPKQHVLASIAGGSVPDAGSTTLQSKRIEAKAGEVVKMRGEAQLRVRALPKDGTAQVVCGLRYSRDGDASWSLGTPYETVSLDRAQPRERVTIERTFQAPADDTYRIATSCHVSTPESGAKVTATGETRVGRGLPRGAATPIE